MSAAGTAKKMAASERHVPFAIKKMKLPAVKPPVRLTAAQGAALDNSLDVLPTRRQAGSSGAAPLQQWPTGTARLCVSAHAKPMQDIFCCFLAKTWQYGRSAEFHAFPAVCL